MRTAMLAVVAFAALLGASPALAAPTCVDRFAQTVRCGSAGAMPVGWTAPADHPLDPTSPQQPSAARLAAVAVLIAAFFGLIALMPDFDGSRGWDVQEADGDEPPP